MTAVVIRGDARTLPLPDASVDLVVTSPPYFGLRSYTDGGEHYAGQIGSEATPQAYVAALVECTREWARVLKPSGSLFVNLGDKYVADNRGSGTDVKRGPAKHAPAGPAGYLGRELARHKSLLGLPWRYALACTDQLGLILRADIVWAKPNGLPESVTDRVRRSHEYVFHFVKQPRYYSAVDEIREPHQPDTWRPSKGGPQAMSGRNASIIRSATGAYDGPNPLGKLPGSVWDIPSQPLTVPAHLGVDHFAAFPMELPRRIIAGWSPPGVCTACGQGRRPVSVTDAYPTRPGFTSCQDGTKDHFIARGSGGNVNLRYRPEAIRAITGYACACPNPTAPTRPALVVDPFAGTGTTMLVAHALGRIGVGVDRSADYCRLAAWRCNDPAQRAAAFQVDKPPPVIDGQNTLFELDEL